MLWLEFCFILFHLLSRHNKKSKRQQRNTFMYFSFFLSFSDLKNKWITSIIISIIMEFSVWCFWFSFYFVFIIFAWLSPLSLMSSHRFLVRFLFYIFRELVSNSQTNIYSKKNCGWYFLQSLYSVWLSWTENKKRNSNIYLALSRYQAINQRTLYSTYCKLFVAFKFLFVRL